MFERIDGTWMNWFAGLSKIETIRGTGHVQRRNGRQKWFLSAIRREPVRRYHSGDGELYRAINDGKGSIVAWWRPRPKNSRNCEARFSIRLYYWPSSERNKKLRRGLIINRIQRSRVSPIAFITSVDRLSRLPCSFYGTARRSPRNV